MSVTRYITIDMLPCGILSPVVCIWTEKPVRYTDYNGNGAGGVWLNRDRKDTSVSMGVSECQDLYGTSPDNDEQLIRVGPRPLLN